ncbi:hypothetical protein [Marinoscillum sp. MHG1-6]|uniref:hypothetical protein n=1 Tax=Marinoscillum sp. MHG1-6 TaxID=2959627 RepID=UPI00215736A5|nr:hypothetical protein [Marinoscillum sp. MHG1-6]
MNPEQKLDKVLTYLNREYANENIKFQHSDNICKLAKLDITPSEAYMVLQKLNSDRYVNVSDSNQWMFQINYNGIVFIRSGGYKQQLKDLKRKRIKNDIYNVAVGLGTLLAGLYALVEIWKYLLAHFC